MADEEIIRRLDAILAVLKLAHNEPLAQARSQILNDAVNAAILETTVDEFVASGQLKRDVAALTEQSEKTVQRRIADLVAMGALELRTEGRPAYRSTGLI